MSRFLGITECGDEMGCSEGSGDDFGGWTDVSVLRMYIYNVIELSATCDRLMTRRPPLCSPINAPFLAIARF